RLGRKVRQFQQRSPEVDPPAALRLLPSCRQASDAVERRVERGKRGVGQDSGRQSLKDPLDLRTTHISHTYQDVAVTPGAATTGIDEQIAAKVCRADVLDLPLSIGL